MTVAVIGLGNIGSGVAANLISAGHQVCVFDLDTSRSEQLWSSDVRIAESARDAVAHADFVFTSLPGPAEIRRVGLGDGDGTGGIMAGMQPGSIWVDLSTNDLETARDLDRVAETIGVKLVDAPVSGGPEGAAAGTLSIFVGGENDAVSKVTPLLETIGDKVDHLGPRGAGIVAKIAQVTLCYTQTVTLIEAMLLGVKGGVDPAKMLDIIGHSAGRSYVSETYGPEILSGTYDASFPLGHAAKDMRLAVSLARSVGAELPYMEAVAALYETAEATYGRRKPHLLAAHLIETSNELVLHELIEKGQAI